MTKDFNSIEELRRLAMNMGMLVATSVQKKTKSPIVELVEQEMEDNFYSDHEEDSGYYGTEETEKSLIRFANAIVAECIQAIMNEIGDQQRNGIQSNTLGLNQAIYSIKDRFGVNNNV
jgi:hypothetical protein